MATNGWRTIKVNSEQAERYPTNEVISSKYTWYNFIFKALFEQFQRAANCYFLLICFLQTWTLVSITGGTPTQAPVLFFILTLSLCKVGYEDYLRHKADAEENGQKVDQFNPETKRFENVTFTECKVGSILKIKNRDQVPSDCCLIASSDTATNAVFVNTKALDGETDLKIREVHTDLVLPKNLANLNPEALAGKIAQDDLKAEAPSKNLLKFEGTYCKNEENVSLDRSNIILRGVQLRQVEWCLAVVLYTGKDTKIQMNSIRPPQKTSTMGGWTSRDTGRMFVIDICMCFVSATIGSIMRSNTASNYFAVGQDTKDSSNRIYMTSMDNASYGEVDRGGISGGFIEWVLNFFQYFLIFTVFIPISLLVTIDFVKFFQKFIIQADLDMYYDVTDTPMRVRSSELNESLGMVSHVFSDKTGTLTCNVMEFRKASINGISYGKGLTQIGVGRFQRENPGKPIPKDPVVDGPKTDFVNFLDVGHTLQKKMDKGNSEDAQLAKKFCLNLALNHEVIPEEVDGSDELIYSGPSPDEVAFVYFAKHMGYYYNKRTRRTATVKINGKNEEYDILEVLKFSSARKRSSVLCRKTGTSGNITVFCKGADNVMKPLLDKSCSRTRKMMKDTLTHIQNYSDDGLRILMIAEKTVSEKWYGAWRARMDNAKNAMENREEKVEAVMAEIEGDLTLCGVTAIEDKLQDGVPKCIASLRKAGIKVWMLTGDKVDTAINIGYACQLIAPDMRVLELTAKASKKAQLDLDKDGIPTQVCLETEMRKALVSARDAVGKNQEVVAVLDTYFLTAIEKYEDFPHLLELSQMCKSFIAARVSPDQKGQIVMMIRDNSSPDIVTLAIGDGANDVNMIQKAHVGVGIEGLEGKQAVNNSDFAIAQFRFLQKLLLCHGRWCYRRMATVSYYMFYKNAFFVFANWFTGFWQNFSGQNYYLEYPLYQGHNMFWTALPIIIFGVFDKDLVKDVCMRVPEVYQDGIKGVYFSNKIFAQWIFEAFVTGIICSCMGLITVEYSSIGRLGVGLYYIGTIIHLCMSVVTNVRLMLIVRDWTWVVVFIFTATIASWFIIMIWLSTSFIQTMQNFFSMNTVGMLEQLVEDEYWWYTLLLANVLCIMPFFAQKAYMSFYRPRTSQLMQEYQYKHATRLGLDKRPVFCCCGKQEGDPREVEIEVKEIELKDMFEGEKDQEYEKRILNINSESTGSLSKENPLTV